MRKDESGNNTGDFLGKVRGYARTYLYMHIIYVAVTFVRMFYFLHL